MRSVVVVLPASTCAMMPMLRISERAVVRAMVSFRFGVPIHTVEQLGRRAGPADISKIICAEDVTPCSIPCLVLANPGLEGRGGRHPIERASEVQSCCTGFVHW